MKVRDILKRLEADGWYEARMKGSHRVLKHPENLGLLLFPVILPMKSRLEL